MPQFTTEQVIALAPDSASARAGRELANPAKWQTLGFGNDVCWGECKGSGPTPYRTRVDVFSMAYKCTCPSRKSPCKHVLGLMLAAASARVPAAAPPEWVEAWLEARRDDAAKRITAGVEKIVDPAASAAAAAKRAAGRSERVALGYDEMERWLSDIVRLGIARVQSERPRFWDAKAARLVDAQAPGLARRVRALAGIAASGAGWEERMLDAFGSLYLLRKAYARIGELSAGRAADVRRYTGWTQREADTLAREGASVGDRWWVIGARSEEDERLVAHRAWLRGERTSRDALVLQFTQPGVPPAHVLVPGTAFEAKLAYFEASVPQRVAIAEREETDDTVKPPAGVSISALLAAYAGKIARDPWFETMPACLAVVQTSRAGDDWYVCDGELAGLPLAPAVDADVLTAVCGAREIVVSGEWNGRTFLPLGAWFDERFVRLV